MTKLKTSDSHKHLKAVAAHLGKQKDQNVPGEVNERKTQELKISSGKLVQILEKHRSC